MEKITLNYKFVIDDTIVSEINYDYADFKSADYLSALSRRKGDVATAVNPVNDYALHFALGVGIILASNKGKGWAAEDFDRLTGSDLWQVTQIGLVFFGARPEEQQQNNSEGQSESTLNASTPLGKSF